MLRSPFFRVLVLLPLSKLFGLVVAVRNHLFNRGILRQEGFGKLPVVVVGNIAVGGTGKTPHTEYITALLRDSMKVGVISRGYRRLTRGFVLAGSRSTPEDIGDEPYQIYQKFGGGADVAVAVAEKRVEGIARLQALWPQMEVAVLDDAFQHRYVKPSVAILLTEYNRPAYADALMPYGRLREPASAINRADIVVVTKCPSVMKPMEFRMFKENLNLFPYQRLFFSKYVYGSLQPVFAEKAPAMAGLEWLGEDDTVLIVTGIANPRPFVRHIRRGKARVRLLRFSDHARYDHADMQAIARKYATLKGRRRIILTTEKDAVKIAHSPYFPPELQSEAFFMPVSVEFMPAPGEDTGFDATLLRLIKKS